MPRGGRAPGHFHYVMTSCNDLQTPGDFLSLSFCCTLRAVHVSSSCSLQSSNLWPTFRVISRNVEQCATEMCCLKCGLVHSRMKLLFLCLSCGMCTCFCNVIKPQMWKETLSAPPPRPISACIHSVHTVRAVSVFHALWLPVLLTLDNMILRFCCEIWSVGLLTLYH